MGHDSRKKSIFEQSEILVVRHLCGPYGRKPSPAKVEEILTMKEVSRMTTEVQRFLGACPFYHIWIPHYTHVVKPLYGLLKKGRKFECGKEHSEAMWRLKGMLMVAPALWKAVYGKGALICVMVNMSSIGIGWVINQEDKGETRFTIRLSAKVLSKQQRGYTKVKQEL